MRFDVVVVLPFLKEFKRLARKYPSLKREVTELSAKLELDPRMGVSIGRGCRKIRLAIASKGRGKSGGGRVITHIHIEGRRLFLLDIYDKSEKVDLTPGELDELLGSIPR